MLPSYNLDKIKFGVDKPTFDKAVDIYDSGGVKSFEDTGFGFSAKVKGSGDNFYEVYVPAKQYDHGSCDCYLGQRDILCKHMIALAICAVMGGGQLSEEDKELTDSPECSGRAGELKKTELLEIKAEISVAMRYIKPYNGPSRLWHRYQDSLLEGCRRLTVIISDFPVSKQTAKLLIDLLLRLDKKLCYGGVDDSDGTVGSFMYEVVDILIEFTELDSACIKTFFVLCDKKTCFGWEEKLVEILDEANVD
ncbi:hypothetical protein L6259_01880 [Candidatus Parcubacteria bacterium]|nr:hypothetical protein [Patescibacteria group bacterium]MCG2694004.1 hypothetical protein [Candidatus Parcubacteria bacterium]